MQDSMGNKRKVHHFLLFWRKEQLDLLLELLNVFFSYYMDL